MNLEPDSFPALVKFLSTPGAVAVLLWWMNKRIDRIEQRLEMLAVYHGAPRPEKKNNRQQNLLLLVGVAVASLFLLGGCTSVKVYDDQRQAGFRAVMPAYPWQDSTAVLERLNISARSNTFTVSVRGFSESENTSTNAVNLVTGVVGAAVGAAIQAAKP
jgi:hypothetical protein